MEQNMLLEQNPADFAPFSFELLWIMLQQQSGYPSVKYCATGKYFLEMLCC